MLDNFFTWFRDLNLFSGWVRPKHYVIHTVYWMGTQGNYGHQMFDDPSDAAFFSKHLESKGLITMIR